MRETKVWTTRQGNGDAQELATGGLWRAVWERAASLWKSVRIRRKTHALHLEETLALGERRMLAIVEWKGEKLLLGVTSQQITLLESRVSGQATAGCLHDEVHQE